MVDQIIRPADLPNRASPNASEKIPVDNGSNVAGATVESIVLAGRPTASQVEAEAGTDAVKAMTPLTVDQKIEYEIGRSIASKAQGDKADSAVQPGDLAVVATSGSYNDLIDKPTLSDETSAESRAWAIANLHPAAAPSFIRTAGYASAGDGGGALYRLVISEPSHAGKFSITLDDGVTVVWYEIAEQVLTERMFGAPCDGDWNYGGTDAHAELQAWASCPASNYKRFTGVSKSSVGIEFPPDTVLEGSGFVTGIDSSGSTLGFADFGPGVCYFNGSDYLTQISNLSATVNTGSTEITLTSATGIVPGDRICIYNPTDYSWASGTDTSGGNRATYRAGEWVRVFNVSGNTLRLHNPLWDGYVSSAVNLYLNRAPQAIARDFRVVPPYIQVVGVHMNTITEPVVTNIRGEGSRYASVLLQRCLDMDVNLVSYGYEDTVSIQNEYALIISSCTGGQILGDYYAQRHAIGFGNSDFICCVPNRSVRVMANTWSQHGVGSLDFGHGCNEGLIAVGGQHTGIAIGGRNHTIIGARSRKGATTDGAGGLCVSGSEFVGGDFVFSGCDFRSFYDTSAESNGMINLVTQSMTRSSCRFVFDDCAFEPHSSAQYVVKYLNSGSTHQHSVVVRNPRIRGGGGITQFVRLTYASGATNLQSVCVTGVLGLGGSVSRCNNTGGFTSSAWAFDPQRGTTTANPTASATSHNQAVSFPWAYPANAVPNVQAWQHNASIGGARCIVIAASPSNTGFTATVMPVSAGTFPTAATGTVGWRADFE